MCDVNKRRFVCTCPPGFTGHRCQFPPLRSCKDVMMIHKETPNGIYNVTDQQNTSFPVYCDFGSEPGAAWTLIQSHSLQNNEVFENKPLYLYDMPINQDAPEWTNYRLSLPRMNAIRDVSTHWRATCNFPTDRVDFRDYWRVSLKSLDLLATAPSSFICLSSEFMNVHGNECSNCTVYVAYSTAIALHFDSYHGPSQGCGLGGGINDEDNFGWYGTANPAFLNWKILDF